MRKRRKQLSSVIFTLFGFLLFSVLSFTAAYAGPETLGPSPVEELHRVDSVRVPAQYFGETPEDAESAITTDEHVLPVMAGQVSSTQKEAAPFRLGSGFDAFNAPYKNQWKASFSEKTGKVKILYGALSKRYENGPESVARGFLGDSHMIFGLKQDLSDLKTLRVDKTPERDHVRFQQTYNNVPIVGVFVLVHSNSQGQVTMVQNDYIQGFQVANAQVIAAEAAKNIARNDLQTSLGKDAILSDAKVEEVIAPHKEKYYYVWKINIPTQSPWGYWVYRVDAATGEILYKGNEIRSLKTGKGFAYKSNADWLLGKISSVPLKYMFDWTNTVDWGYLWGLHAYVLNNNGDDPRAYDYKFLYDPATQKDWFDATDGYYQMNTIWEWWNKNIIRKYGPASPDYFYQEYPFPAITFVNVIGMCNAFYSPDIIGGGFPGFAFGNENSCTPGSEDLVIDSDVVRHEFTHAMMDWCGFDAQFGGPPDYYGRAMGEGNGDWFAFLTHTQDPHMCTVAFDWYGNGYLRNLDNTRMYPRDVDCPTCPPPNTNMPEEHYTGEIWGGYLYDLYRVLGKNALKYVYQSFFYFSPTGPPPGFMSSYPDFYDAISAQATAEYDHTGKQTSSFKAWGSMTSRGINGVYLRSPYCSSNYFFTGSYGCDNSYQTFGWRFPPYKTINTKGNLLLSGDPHDYYFNASQSGLDLTATVTGTAGGLINPFIALYDLLGNPWPATITSSSTKATLTYSNLPEGDYIVRVTGGATSPARGYYSLKLGVK